MRARLLSLAGRGRHLAMGGLFMLVISAAAAVLAQRPAWESVPQDAGLVRLSLTLSGARVCRERTPEELATLPANMRSAQTCERRRAPVRIEMDIDDMPVIATDRPPSGLAGSGPSRIYERLVLPAGDYRISLRLRDDPTVAGYTHETTREVRLAPGQNLAIDFRAATGQFIFH
ncbi:MAG TPA: hypothetical protein GX700_12705 [Paracoccus sp.]|nr:hypothetical protein [Paracoccus sp. (in: a-proteobacteria)]